MKGRFFLDIVVRKGTTILELLSSEDETLLIRVDEFFVLNLSLHIVNRVQGVYFQVIVLPVRVLTKTCIPPRRRMSSLNLVFMLVIDLFDILGMEDSPVSWVFPSSWRVELAISVNLRDPADLKKNRKFKAPAHCLETNLPSKIPTTNHYVHYQW